MIEVACPRCGFHFEVIDDALGLTADCPHCQAELVVGALPGEGGPLDEDAQPLPLDESAAPSEREITLATHTLKFPEPPPLDEQTRDRLTEHALGGGRPLDELSNAVAQPKVAFVRDAARSFGVLLGGANKHLWLAFAAADLLLVIALGLIFAGSAGTGIPLPPFLLAGFAVGVLPLCWVASIWFRAVQVAITGHDDVKLVGFDHGVLEDLLVPAAWLVASLLLAFVPLWVYWATLAAVDADGPLAADLAMAALGLFFWPATVLVLVMGDSLSALTPENLFRMIFGAFGPYLAIWACLLAVGGIGSAVGVVAWALTQASGLAKTCPLLGLFVLVYVLSLTVLLAMRITGLMYRHFKARLPFAAE